MKKDSVRTKPGAPRPAKPAKSAKPMEKSAKSAKPAEKTTKNAKPIEKPAKEMAPPLPPKRYINVYLSVGSNMGDRLQLVRKAAGLIHKNLGKIARKSHIYETQAWGKTDQDPFLNQVLMINTIMAPRDLLEKIAEIEREMGRERKEKWGPRTMDIDILFYGKRVIRDKGLEVPHPELHKRLFVLAPMLEIAPELEHPILKQPIDELFMACQDLSEVIKTDES